MSRYKMHAIEYNSLMTLLKLLSDELPDIVKQYGTGGDIKVLPSYPRDITKMFKPSIIVRRVDTSQYKLGLANFIGQLFDKKDNSYTDAFGIGHDIMVQFDVVSNSNSQMSLLTSALSEDIFNNLIITHGGHFQLYDFTANEDNPTEMGVITIDGTPSVTYIPKDDVRPNLNNDYISAIRLTFTVVQEIIPKQEYIDLSKWIKIKQTIKVK